MQSTNLQAITLLSFLLALILSCRLFFVSKALIENTNAHIENELLMPRTSSLSPSFTLVNRTTHEAAALNDVITIAYAVTVTSCEKPNLIIDGASVLRHSIHLTSIQTKSSGSRYDYEMIAFVHPNATACSQILSHLHYKVIVKEVPIQIEHIRGNYRQWADKGGCCGVKEWLKLYAYTLTQYPVVVHLDLDCLVLKPMDDLFDAMIFPVSDTDERGIKARQRIPAMWFTSDQLPEVIDAFFTRDYGMVQKPGRRKPHQVGVQGGFLVIQPNKTIFQEYIDIILEGNYSAVQGWGGALEYGGYYGAGTIQGLAAMFYGHLYPHRAVELNRCIYNNMADTPYPTIYDERNLSHMKPYPCLTLQKSCDDCRNTSIQDIVSIHFTNCMKPWFCAAPWRMPPACLKLRFEWYRIRFMLEAQLRREKLQAPNYSLTRDMGIRNSTLGFCNGIGNHDFRSIATGLKDFFNVSSKI
jgi:hypothetical protein